ncbi:MAG TPA: LPS export ABC transporter ATP-binding protein [Gemmatimonadaceae bacterium]|nr:LPS export ABC transporter ATP-binding protein [Gemmatimonadaceae bacterium]
MSDAPRDIRAIADKFVGGDRSTALALLAVVRAADADGAAIFNDVATRYREDYLAQLRSEGRDAEREAGRLSLDEVRAHLGSAVLPRLAATGALELPPDGLKAPDQQIKLGAALWAEVGSARKEFADALRATGEHATIPAPPERPAATATGSVLEAKGLTKVYRNRTVVSEVDVQLRQGEIVGLLGPNGAGKTTTFYMIVGIIPPMHGTVTLDGKDITRLPMYKRARQGIGYLSQEPSVFRKLTVEENLLAILETLPIKSAERKARLESLLDELSIKHLRHNKAYALSGGERRRLEITRSLVTRPKFMMLDEPFAGVDPIAVHDIQTIVAGLRHRGIGVLISDHNVEQTLDIVDRAYILFDGHVQVSGTVRDLVFDDKVAEIYLGPTLTARLRDRFMERERRVAAV